MAFGRLALSLGFAARGGGLSDPDAIAYVAAVESADGEAMPPGARQAVDAFVIGLKADGQWEALKACTILAGAQTLAGALVPLKGAAPTNTGFVEADLDPITGLIGDGSTKLLGSGRANDDDPQNSHHLSVWRSAVDMPASNTGVIGCGAGSGNDTHIAIRTDLTSFYRSRSIANASLATTLSAGFLGMSRGDVSTIDVAIHTGAETTLGLTAAAPTAEEIVVFGRDGVAQYAGRLGWYSIGEDVDLVALRSRVAALMAGIATDA